MLLAGLFYGIDVSLKNVYDLIAFDKLNPVFHIMSEVAFIKYPIISNKSFFSLLYSHVLSQPWKCSQKFLTFFLHYV